MKYLNEKIIVDKFDKPTNRMLDGWHSECEKIFGKKIDVILVDRKNVPQLSNFEGEIYTATITNDLVKNNTVLAVIVNSFRDVSHLLVSHEIGHFVLKIKGFSAFSYQLETRNDFSIYFNSMIQHPAIYSMQESFGHNPQVEIVGRVKNNIKIFSADAEDGTRDKRLLNAFMLADDFLNVDSKQLKIELRDVLKTKHQYTLRHVDEIIDIASYYDVEDMNENSKFSKRVLKNLKFERGLWEEFDNITPLRKLLETSA